MINLLSLDNIVLVSDVHLDEENSDAKIFLLNFFSHPVTKESNHIIFLGDIFDFLCGNHPEYLIKYSWFFNLVKIRLETTKISFFEGNHDFHFREMLKESNLFTHSNLFYYQKPQMFTIADKTYYFSHGDEFLYSTWTYYLYRQIVLSKFLKYTINKLPFSLISKIGIKLSNSSRKKNNNIPFHKIESFETFYRNSAIKLFNKGIDYVICGHSHIFDNFNYISGNTSHHYLNCGFPLKHQRFLHIFRGNFEFIHVNQTA